MAKLLAWILSAGLWCSAQTMPYPVGYVYTTSVLDEESRAVTGATVSDTYGESGHTTSAVVKITSPDGRVTYGTGAWGYSSFASAGLSLCDSSGTCYDGLFTIRSEGTQEYCPIAFAYLLLALSYADQELQPYAYAKSARWVPEAVHFQKGETKFYFTVVKTAGCSTGNAGLTFNASPNPSIMVFKIISDPQKTISFSGQEAQADWEVRFDANNGTIGEVLGTGILNSAPCQIPIPSSRKEATLRVQAP